MAEVDASIYGKLKQPDPLGMVKDIVGLQGSITQNRLLEMQAQGKEQLGRAIQEATDPNGVVDQVKLSEILKRPENWAAAQEGAGTGLALQASQLANQGAGMDIAKAGYTSLGTLWGARASQSQGDINPDDLRQDVLELVARNGLDPKQAISILRSIPSDKKLTRAYATGGFLQALGPGGMAAPAPAAPGEEGETRQQTAGQFVAESLGAAKPTEAAAPTEAAKPGVTTGVPPAKAAALPIGGAAAAQAAARLADLGAQTAERKGILNNMLADASEFTSGPASEELKTAIAAINEVFGTKFNVERVAAQERFDKLANQIALAQAGALNITDARTETAMGANPNSRLSNLGIEGVIAMLKGTEDAIAAKDEAFQDAIDDGEIEPEEYFRFSRKWNENYDPRVFQSVYLTQEQKLKMLRGLSKAELAEFKRKYNFAVENGWIPDPR